MKSISIVSAELKKQMKANGNNVCTVVINDVECNIAIVETPDPIFDADAEEFLDSIYIRKRAFSLNFRDRGITSYKQERLNQEGCEIRYSYLGSDFVGEVILVGKNVKNLKPGDRVIPNCAYPNENPKAPDGIPTNEASKSLHVLHHASVFKIDDDLTDEVGASFSVSAQTSYSILRRLNLQGSERILVTSGSSNTSLSILNALIRGKKHQNITVMTSRATEIDKFNAMGVNNVILINNRQKLQMEPAFILNIKRFGYFNVIIDPFADTHLMKLVNYMSFNGRYITCGLYNQTKITNSDHDPIAKPITYFLNSIITRNIQIIGNCLGTSRDLEKAILDYKEGRFLVYIDKVYRVDELESFIHHSYSYTGRFGKVVCLL